LLRLVHLSKPETGQVWFQLSLHILNIGVTGKDTSRESEGFASRGNSNVIADKPCVQCLRISLSQLRKQFDLLQARQFSARN